MNACPIDALAPETPLWVWDGSWLPAHLIETLLVPSTGWVLVRFNHGISAPIAASRILLRDPALHESDRPSANLSAMMYGQSLLAAVTPFASQPRSLRPSTTKSRANSPAHPPIRRPRRVSSRSSL